MYYFIKKNTEILNTSQSVSMRATDSPVAPYLDYGCCTAEECLQDMLP